AKSAAARAYQAAAWYHAQLGDYPTARARRDEANRLLAEIREPPCRDCDFGLDWFLPMVQGDVADAAAIIEKGLAAAGDSGTINNHMLTMGELWLVRGDLAEARAQFHEALASYDQKGAALMSRHARLGIGLTYLEEGHPARAEEIFRHLVEDRVTQQSSSLTA